MYIELLFATTIYLFKGKIKTSNVKLRVLSIIWNVSAAMRAASSHRNMPSKTAPTSVAYTDKNSRRNNFIGNAARAYYIPLFYCPLFIPRGALAQALLLPLLVHTEGRTSSLSKSFSVHPEGRFRDNLDCGEASSLRENGVFKALRESCQPLDLSELIATHNYQKPWACSRQTNHRSNRSLKARMASPSNAKYPNGVSLGKARSTILAYNFFDGHTNRANCL